MPDETFDKGIREKFESFEPKIPNDLWSSIAEQLDENPMMPIAGRAKRKNTFTWLRVAAAVAVLIGLGMYYVRPTSEVVYLSAKEEVIDKKVKEEEAKASVRLETKSGDIVDDRQASKSYDYASNVRRKEQAAIALESRAAEAEHVELRRPVIEEEVFAVEAPSYERGDGSPSHVQLSLVKTPVLSDKSFKLREKKSFGVDEILNYVVRSVGHGEEKVLSFASDDEGTLKVAVDLKAIKIRL